MWFSLLTSDSHCDFTFTVPGIINVTSITLVGRDTTSRYTYNLAECGIFYQEWWPIGENGGVGSRLTNEPGYLFGLSWR